MALGKRPIVDLTGDDDDVVPLARPRLSGSATQPIDLDDADADAGSGSMAAGSTASSTAGPSISSTTGPSSSTADPSPSGEWLRPAAEVTCPICMTETPPAEAASLEGCKHTFCEDCIGQYVSGKVLEGQVLPDQLRCPSVDPKCGETIVPADVARCLKEPGAVARYERLTLQRCIEAADGMGVCPSPGCEFMFAFDEDNRKLDCPLCKESFCLVCRVSPWHSGVRCETYQAEHGNVDEADKLFNAFASQQKLKQCPKCKYFVEKTSGCDAMHCRCNLVFCYKCGGCLKASGKYNIKRCECNGMQPYLQAHQGVPNHNLQQPQPVVALPVPPQVGAGFQAAMAAMQAAIMPRRGRWGRR